MCRLLNEKKWYLVMLFQMKVGRESDNILEIRQSLLESELMFLFKSKISVSRIAFLKE